MDINLMKVCCIEYLHIYNKYALTLKAKLCSLPTMMCFLFPETPVDPTWPGAELSAPPTELTSHPRSITAVRKATTSFGQQHRGARKTWLSATPASLNWAQRRWWSRWKVLAFSKISTLNVSFFVSNVNEVAEAEGGKSSLGLYPPL